MMRNIILAMLLLLLSGCGKEQPNELSPAGREYRVVAAQLEILNEKGIDEFWDSEVAPNSRNHTIMKNQLDTMSKYGKLRLASLEAHGKSLKAVIEAEKDGIPMVHAFLLNDIDGKWLWATGI